MSGGLGNRATSDNLPVLSERIEPRGVLGESDDGLLPTRELSRGEAASLLTKDKPRELRRVARLGGATRVSARGVYKANDLGRSKPSLRWKTCTVPLSDETASIVALALKAIELMAALCIMPRRKE